MIHFVDSAKSAQLFLEIFSADIEKAPEEERFITVDTEFIRENLEKPLLCLVQITTGKSVFVIDPISVGISFLKRIFEDEKLPKIFHSAAQDIEVLHNSGIHTKNIYDTQLHEMLLSTKEQISYQAIVQKYLDKKISKDYSLSNWKQRPLSKKQIKYSIEDVTHLREIYRKQTNELKKLRRLEWLIPEMKSLEQEHNETLHSNNEQKIFRQLSEWIENRAKEKNIDSKKIADEQAVMRICRKGRHYVNKMLKYRGLINEDFKELLLFAKDIVPEDVYEFQKQNPIVSALRLILEMCSVKNNIASVLIANSKDLENIANNFKNAGDIALMNVKCLHGWRKELFGKYALDFLNEKISLVITDGQLGFLGFSEK